MYDHWVRRQRGGFPIFDGILLGTRPLGAEATGWVSYVGRNFTWYTTTGPGGDGVGFLREGVLSNRDESKAEEGGREFPLYTPGEGLAGNAVERGILFYQGGQARGR